QDSSLSIQAAEPRCVAPRDRPTSLQEGFRDGASAAEEAFARGARLADEPRSDGGHGWLARARRQEPAVVERGQRFRGPLAGGLEARVGQTLAVAPGEAKQRLALARRRSHLEEIAAQILAPPEDLLRRGERLLARAVLGSAGAGVVDELEGDVEGGLVRGHDEGRAHPEG